MKCACAKLFFGVSLFFCLAFLLVPGAKATDNVYVGAVATSTYFSGGFYYQDINVPSDCGNAHLLTKLDNGWNVATTTPSIGGINMNTFGYTGTYDNYENNSRYFLFAQNGLPTGTTTIAIANNDNNYVSSFVMCNVSQTDPAYFQQAGTNSITINNTTYGDLGFIIGSSQYAGPNCQRATFTGGTDIQNCVNNYQNEGMYSSYLLLNLGNTSTNPSGTRYNYVIDFHYEPAHSCGDTVCQTAYESCSTCASDCGVCNPTGTILWAGTGTNYGLIGGYWHIPIYYNFCSSYSLIKYAYLTIGGSNTWGFTPILGDQFGIPKMAQTGTSASFTPQICSGVVIIDKAVNDFTNPFTQPWSGDLEVSLHMGGYGVINSSDDEIQATTTVPTVVNNGATSINYLDPVMDNPLNIPVGNGTTTETFSYDFTNLAWANSQVCLYNARESIKSSYCTAIASSTGYETIDFPNIDVPTQLLGQYILYSSTSVPIFKSKQFTVNWVVNGGNEPGKVPCNPPSLDLTNTCDAFDVSGSGITMGKLQCGLVVGLKATGFALFVPGCDSMNTFNDSYNIFKRAFPFNAFYDLTDTIDTAIASTSTSTASTIGIPFIDRNSTSTNKYYVVPVVSSSSMSNAIGSDNNNTFRITLAFLGWLLVAGVVYLTVRKI